jgi:hypothetical protein
MSAGARSARPGASCARRWRRRGGSRRRLGYHYYPGRERVLDWLAAEGLEVLEETEATPPEEDWGYRHFLLRDAAPRTT